MSTGRRTIIWKEPPQDWSGGVPVGNGRIGAVIYGTPSRTVLALNEDTLWSGYPDDGQKSILPEELVRVRRLTEEGRYPEAMHLLEEKMQETEDVQMYEPAGHLVFERDSYGQAWRGYRRELDLETAVCSTSWREGETVFTQEVFVSAPAQCLVFSLHSSRPFSGRLSAEEGFIRSVRCVDGGEAACGDEAGVPLSGKEAALLVRGELPGRCGYTVGTTPNHRRTEQISEDPAKRGILYEGRALVEIPACGSTAAGEEAVSEKERSFVRADGNGIVCRNVRDLVIRFVIRTSFTAWNVHPYLQPADFRTALDEDVRRVRGTGYEELRDGHVADYRSFYDRVQIRLAGGKDAGDNPLSGGGRKKGEEIPEEEFSFDERVSRFLRGEDDPDLTALTADFGRYLLISSSRPGTQAANLQGIWNDDPTPPWFSDYTVNINLEMNYWLAGPAGLPEMVEPLTALCCNLTENGRKTAAVLHDAGGSACYHNTDLWCRTAPANGRAMWAYWPFGSAWLCRNLYDEYLFTKDRDYLREIMPVLRENAVFVMDILTETPEGLAPSPATSPENEFMCGGEKCSVARYTENTLAITRNLLRDLIEGAGEAGMTEDGKTGPVVQRAKTVLPRLVPVRTGSAGQILEWNGEFEEADLHHRHLSHLYELHPGRGIGRGRGQNPDLLQAARLTLERRGMAAEGWSLVWRALMWARLGEGEKSQALLRRYYGCTAADPPGGGAIRRAKILFPEHAPFQIDENFGFTAAVFEMLLHSDGEEIVILPAIPASWTEGSVRGLCARGNIRADFCWKDGAVRWRLVSGEERQKVSVGIGKGPLQEVELLKGTPVEGCGERI